MSEIKSIWDGWEKQCYGTMADETGALCALGFVFDWDLWNSGVRQEHMCLHPKTATALRRVAAYLRGEYSIPKIYVSSGCIGYPQVDDRAAIAYANNEIRLTPEDFRRIDRETQIEEALKSIETRDKAFDEAAGRALQALSDAGVALDDVTRILQPQVRAEATQANLAGALERSIAMYDRGRCGEVGAAPYPQDIRIHEKGLHLIEVSKEGM